MDTRPEPFDVRARTFPELLSWRELVTLRRLRLAWTKERLSTESGVARMWLWRGLECDPAHPRYVTLSASVRERVEDALEHGEAEQAAEQREAAEQANVA